MDDRPSFDSLPRWMGEARAFGLGPSVPLFLVATKADETRAVTADEARAFAEREGLSG